VTTLLAAFAFAKAHWRGLLVAIGLAVALVGGAVAGWRLKPSETPDAEIVNVPVRDLDVEQKLQTQVAELQHQLAEAKTSSHSSARYTAPDGGSFALDCGSESKSAQACEATQVAAQQCEQRVVYRDREVPVPGACGDRGGLILSPVLGLRPLDLDLRDPLRAVELGAAVKTPVHLGPLRSLGIAASARPTDPLHPFVGITGDFQ
jgi:hypothetical protein